MSTVFRRGALDSSFLAPLILSRQHNIPHHQRMMMSIQTTQRILVAIAALLLGSSRHIIVTSFSPTFEPHALSITIGLNAATKQRFAAVGRRSTTKRRRNGIHDDNLDHRFIDRTSSSTTTAINLIKGEAYGSEPFDENEGGVGLAKRSVVKISGVTTYSSAGDGSSSSSNSNSEARELVRYSKLHELDDITAIKSMLEKMNCQLLYAGKGIELYQDPGKSYRIEEKVIQLAPIMAVKDALLASSSSTASSSTSISMSGGDTDNDDGYDDELVINFLGGDELIIGEVMEACNLLVNELDESILRRYTKKEKIVKFNSISYAQIPSDVCYVTVIAVGGGGRHRSGDGLDGGGVDESIAKGEIYIQDGKWWTVFEEDSIVTN